MNKSRAEAEPRILIVDDNPSIHEDFRKILCGRSEAQARLDDIEAEIFGESSDRVVRDGFRIESAHQGREALSMVEKAVKEGDPYVLAFVDVRMPPGWDGIDTLEQIWQCAPELQAVICTAYSDYSWDDMTRRLGQTDNLLILKKPFETVEVLQLAHALTQKWTLARQAKLRMEDLDRMVQQRTEELRGSEERFSKAFHCSPNPATILSCGNRRFLDVNQTFLELSGYTAQQLTDKTDQQLQIWGSETEADLFLPEGRLRNLRCQLRRSDGTIRQIVLSSEPVDFGPTPCLLLVAEDITDEKKLESQLRQAQKLEVIGRMAAGIAHEFNNVLTVIQGNVGLLQTASANKLDRNALLNQVMIASQRAATFTKQLLAFSRKQVLRTRLLNLSALVQTTRKMLSQLLGENYEVRVRCPMELPSVLADDGGIEQVLINLALNARDAMPKGGIIEIVTEICVVDKTTAALNHEARPGRFVCMTVSDHGCGMEPEVLSRIFDPFFTTKDVGKGTGLGLSTIHGIIKQHEGWIDVTSEIGHGTRFRIFLPASEAALALVTDGPQNHLALPEPGNGETILVVEDELSVRELACEALQKHGYQVLQAANGPEAVSLWDRCTIPINLLLADMIMPCGMNGGELAKILQSRNSQLKVLYVSGYSPEVLRKDSLFIQGINFLPKPYDFPTLLKAVRTCLKGGELAGREKESHHREATALI